MLNLENGLDAIDSVIKNIPWEENPAFAFNEDAEGYITAFKRVLDIIPDAGEYGIDFNDDSWDFNSYVKEGNDHSYVINFEGFPGDTKRDVKFFALFQIIQNSKISTTGVRVQNLRTLVNGIFKRKNYSSLNLVCTEDIIEEIINKPIGHSTMHNYYAAAFIFFEFYKGNNNIAVNVDVELLKSLSAEAKRADKNNPNRIPLIPDEYFEKIIETSIHVMNDNKAPYNDRVTAAMILIDTQTGFRTGDLLRLHVGDLRSIKLPNSGKESNYIHFSVRKASKSDFKFLECDIFATNICKTAFKFLIDFRDKEIGKTNDYICIYKRDHKNCKIAYPIDENVFRQHYKRFFYKYLYNEVKTEWPGISPSTVNLTNDIRRPGEDRTAVVNVPEIRQFRTQVCTYLYQNYSLVWIKKFMGHLTDYMLGYYVRPTTTFVDNVEQGEKLVKAIVEDNAKLLGGSGGDYIADKIREFVNENNINVSDSFEQIIEEFEGKLTIRGKKGGFCIKASGIPCSKDVRTNRILCSGNLCPNLFHTFFTVDDAYVDFKSLTKTYTALIDSNDGQMCRAAEKELKKIKGLITRRLAPEIEELENEIALKGKEAIVERYPELKSFIDNLDEIKGEIMKWM